MGIRPAPHDDVPFFDTERLAELRFAENGKAYAEALRHNESALMIEMLDLNAFDAYQWALLINARNVMRERRYD